MDSNLSFKCFVSLNELKWKLIKFIRVESQHKWTLVMSISSNKLKVIFFQISHFHIFIRNYIVCDASLSFICRFHKSLQKSDSRRNAHHASFGGDRKWFEIYFKQIISWYLKNQYKLSIIVGELRIKKTQMNSSRTWNNWKEIYTRK